MLEKKKKIILLKRRYRKGRLIRKDVYAVCDTFKEVTQLIKEYEVNFKKYARKHAIPILGMHTTRGAEYAMKGGIRITFEVQQITIYIDV